MRWLGEQLDEDELWAVEASRRDDEPSVEGGVHWRWMNTATDEEIVPDPERESYVGELVEATASLRSRETWPTSSGVGELPQFAIKYPEEVPSAVGGHIIRHDPARVLREIEAKRQAIAHFEQIRQLTKRDLEAYVLAESAVAKQIQIMACAYADRPGYDESWRP